MRFHSLYERHHEVLTLNKKIIQISIGNKFPYIYKIQICCCVVKRVLRVKLAQTTPHSMTLMPTFAHISKQS